MRNYLNIKCNVCSSHRMKTTRTSLDTWEVRSELLKFGFEKELSAVHEELKFLMDSLSFRLMKAAVSHIYSITYWLIWLDVTHFSTSQSRKNNIFLNKYSVNFFLKYPCITSYSVVKTFIIVKNTCFVRQYLFSKQ